MVNQSYYYITVRSFFLNIFVKGFHMTNICIKPEISMRKNSQSYTFVCDIIFGCQQNILFEHKFDIHTSSEFYSDERTLQ